MNGRSESPFSMKYSCYIPSWEDTNVNVAYESNASPHQQTSSSKTLCLILIGWYQVQGSLQINCLLESVWRLNLDLPVKSTLTHTGCEYIWEVHKTSSFGVLLWGRRNTNYCTSCLWMTSYNLDPFLPQQVFYTHFVPISWIDSRCRFQDYDKHLTIGLTRRWFVPPHAIDIARSPHTNSSLSLWRYCLQAVNQILVKITKWREPKVKWLYINCVSAWIV